MNPAPLNHQPVAWHPVRRAVAGVLATALTAPIAWADSTSSASSAVSTSAGSASESLGTSSNSSSRATGVAQGPYTVLEVAEVPQRPDLLQLHLQAQAPRVTTSHAQAPATLLLRLPRETALRADLQAGQTVLAQPRPYGVAFAKANPGTTSAQGPAEAQPFYLVLDDERHRELHSHPVGG